MKCINCGHTESKVVDSRSADNNSSIRRRRECEKCGFRFTTYEKREKISLMVTKKSKRREDFDKEKIIAGLMHSCEKRPITIKKIETIANEIEESLQEENIREITTHKIGDLILEKLKDLDEIAYIRFASVYKEFSDVKEFLKEINSEFNKKD